MSVDYEKVGWADYPETTTPISAANLSIMDQGIADCAAAVNECFTYASNGKTAIAAAITGKGVDSTSDDTFSEMATKISNIPNSNSGTYSVTSNGTHDMGSANTYRYVKASGIAKKIGTYTANTTVDVSSTGATSASQFIGVCESKEVDKTAYWGSGYSNITARGVYTKPSFSLSGSTLTVNVGTLATYQVGTNAGWETGNLTTTVYFIGN